MVDSRIKKAAEILVNHSARIKKGDRVQIIGDPTSAPLVKELFRLVLKKGAYPRVHISLPGMAYIFYKNAQKHHLTRFPKVAWYEIQNTDAILYIGGSSNTRELSSIDPKKMSMRQKASRKISEYRVNKTRWVIFDYPTAALAQDADMSLEEFEDFVFSSTNVNWKKEEAYLKKVARLVNRTKKVHIVAKNTDLKFDITGRKAIPSAGLYNMPDGEVFTAPIKTSVEGYIEYSFPAIYGGREVNGIRLEFKKGKIVKATAKKNEAFLKQMLNTDPGAKYLGEFGIGLNYNIKNFVKQILFDEKIGGTIHLAAGAAYKECRGKNKSAVHWDMIKDMRKGGKMYFDGKLVYKNGRFIKL